MPYERGNEGLELEVYKLQLFAEDTSGELHGTPEKKGIIDLVRKSEMREEEQKVSQEASEKRLTKIVAIGALIPILLKIAEHFHWF